MGKPLGHVAVAFLGQHGRGVTVGEGDVDDEGIDVGPDRVVVETGRPEIEAAVEHVRHQGLC